MLFGFEEKIKIFKNLFEKNQLSQAYLFYGESEIGKFTFAKSFAYYLEYGEFEILPKPLIDYLEIVPDPEKKNIGIETVRQIKNFLSQTPFKSSKRFLLIDQAETLTQEAQSALLKIVEEPFPSSLIILISPDPSVFLPPLASRLVKIYFPRFSQKRIEDFLVKFKGLSEKEAKKIAFFSFGRIGRALKILENPSFLKNYHQKDLEDYLDQKILSFYFKDKIRYSKILSFLILKSWQVKLYNLNTNLQLKIIDDYLKKYE